jgi:asparagine synthase (glutamine-hydrolysing)
VCGICGVWELGSETRVTEETLRAMNDTLVHRGPDDQGCFVSGPIGLAMRRLSIVDLATGHQPICNEDKTVWTVFNGEIYNHLELRRDLEAKHHVFATETDTEVLVHLYEEYGDQLLERVNGMFAFAIWDDKKKRLLLARDRVGIKPLYYSRQDGRLMFASELKALLAHPRFQREVDLTGLDLYFRFRFIPAPFTIFKDVYKLPAGHLLTVQNHDVSVRRYWDVTFEPDDARNEEEFGDELLELVGKSVAMRLRADVPVGAFLSGGVDSSAIVSLMQKASSTPVKTFSMGFDETFYDESSHARLVAQNLKLEHHEFTFRPDAVRLMDQYVWHFDEPFADPAALPTLMLSRMTREHVTVALTGDGGDEVFAGYHRYWSEWAMKYYGYVPRWFRNAAILPLLNGIGRFIPLEMRLKDYVAAAAKRTALLAVGTAERYPRQFSPFTIPQHELLYAPEIRQQMTTEPPAAFQEHFENALAKHWLSRCQYVDLKTLLPEQMLTKVDRTTMAYGLEARVPLLDHRIVELAARIPPRLLMSAWQLKRFFKRSVRSEVPNEILQRPKHGFQVPLGQWFRRELREYMEDALSPGELDKHGLLDRETVATLLARHQSGRNNNENQLFALLVFQRWWTRFVDSPHVSATRTVAPRR